MKQIYLDHAATTALDKKVLEKMLPYFCEEFGNPHSLNHSFGYNAASAVEEARGRVASVIGAQPEEIIFTSGATESNNLAIKGAARFYKSRGNHIITCVTEHKCVLESCKALEREGFEVTYLPVMSNGLIDFDVYKNSIKNSTILVSIMTANNEIGVVQDINSLAMTAKSISKNESKRIRP